jgi:RNA polymerase sigma-70 factor (ECF subfamily)
VSTREATPEHLSRRFPTTSWTTVAAAARDSSGSAGAVSKLCEAYWFPVYAFIRRGGHSREEAEDLYQEFFATVLQNGALAGARPERGKFRSFLLASVTNFVANQWDREHALKRGGGCTVLSLDFEASEHRYVREPSHDLTPEAVFERQWALTLLDRVLARLRDEHRRNGHAAQFDILSPFLTGDQDRDAYERLHRPAYERTRSPDRGASVASAVCRVGSRRDCSRVADPEEVESEIRFLFAALERV